MMTTYISLVWGFSCESWDSHWDRCYECVAHRSQPTVRVCFVKGLWLVKRALGSLSYWLLVLPGNYALVQQDVGKEEGACSQRAPNWEMPLQCRAQQGKLGEAMRMEIGGLRKGRNYISETTEDFSRDLQETTNIQQGKNKRLFPFKDDSRQGLNLLSNTIIWIYTTQQICCIFHGFLLYFDIYI